MTPIQFHTDFVPKEKTATKTGEDLHIYTCPFCEKEDHFYYFPSNTTWDCKVCGRKGNKYGFIQHLYNEVCNKNITGLSQLWQLPKRVFSEVRYNPLNGTYVIPTFRNEKLNNLYKFCLLYTSPSPRDRTRSRMPSSA